MKYWFFSYSSKISPTQLIAAATVGNPTILVISINAWYISSSLAPFFKALLVWLWTPPSDLSAADTANFIKCCVFLSIGPASSATLPSSANTFPYFSNRSLIFT